MRICLLSLSPIADDPRVRRQGDALAAVGHEVVAIGFGGARSAPPSSWRILEVPRPSRSTFEKVGTAVRLVPARLSARLAYPAYWTFAAHRMMYALARAERPDRIHANDWRVLPVATRLRHELGTPFVYDSHEWAVEENIEQRQWRAVFPPFVGAIEAAAIGQAESVVTVSDGIADLLHASYHLPARPTVIANMPPYQESPFRRASEPVTVLYQGVFNPDRGLDTLVRSVEAWAPDRRLWLRGLGPPAMVERLRSLAARPEVRGRVEILPPAPMTELVRVANEADIGIHPIPGKNRQSRYALPNKLFEYVMAGLAVCVSSVPEMARVLERYPVGRTIDGDDEEAIASAVNSFTVADVDAYKRGSLAAAHELCWEHEEQKLLAAHRA